MAPESIDMCFMRRLYQRLPNAVSLRILHPCDVTGCDGLRRHVVITRVASGPLLMTGAK